MDRKKLIEKLNRLARQESLSHAYIFEAPSWAFGEIAADAFIRAILCRNPGEDGPCGSCLACRKLEHDNYGDLIVVEPDGESVKSIKTEAILELQTRLKNRPYEGERNVALIRQGDRMTPEAQNKLLKTLEEPPGKGVLIILSCTGENLLPTVRSRCVFCRFDREDFGAEEALEPELLEAAREVEALLMAGEGFYRISQALTPAGVSHDTARTFLDLLEDRYRERLLSPTRTLSGEELQRQVYLLEDARRRLTPKNRPIYILKDMIMKIMAGGLYD